MNRRRIVIAGLLAALLLTAGLAAYHWREAEAVRLQAKSRNVTLLGSDLIVLRANLDRMLTGTSTRDSFAAGAAWHAATDAGRRARYIQTSAAGTDEALPWHTIASSVESVSALLPPASGGSAFTDDEWQHMQAAKELADALLAAVKRSDANNGTFPGDALREAVRAAERFNRSIGLTPAPASPSAE